MTSYSILEPRRSGLAVDQRFHFSLRSLLIATAIAGVVLGVVIPPIVMATQQEGIYLAPYYLLGDAFEPLTVLLLWCSPLLLIVMIICLAKFSPRPLSVWIFFACMGVAILAIPGGFNHFGWIRFMTSITVVASLSTLVEVAARNLKAHAITAACSLLLALTYYLLMVGVRYWI